MGTMQRQRFELKYVVTEAVALGVRDFVAAYLDLDDFATGRPDLSYPVHSLYLDSPDFALYRATINGDRNRYKLRMRFYEHAEDGPLFLEIKRRINNVIRKQRATIHRADAHRALAGHIPDPWPGAPPDSPPGARPGPSAAVLDALQSFTLHVNQLNAEPKTYVRYLREAWVAEGSNKVRVTLDREVLGERRTEPRFDPAMDRPVRVFGDSVILELKFCDRFPGWMRELVQGFGLRQRSAAKYVDGVYRMGERGMVAAYI